MGERPLSDRRRHEHAELDWEVRGWVDPPGHRPDVEGWRSLGWSATHDDAVVLARGITEGGQVEFAEVWGPAEVPTPGHTRTCERFPAPDADERRAIWLRACTEVYTADIDLPRHRFA